jgi:hypothetical protein
MPLSLRESLVIFEDELPEIRKACLSNASHIIKENSPYKELDVDEPITKEAIHLHVNHLKIEQGAKPLFDTIRRIDSYRQYKDTPPSENFVTDFDIQNVKNVDEDWFIYEAELNHKKIGKCPFHPDKDPSLTLMKSKQTDNLYLKCFPCDKAWNSVSFIMDRDNLTFIEAVKRILKDI